MKNNLMDVLLLLLKAAVLDNPTRHLVLTKDRVMSAENFDLEMRRTPQGNVELKLKGGEGGDSRIIIPNGASPLTIVKG